MADEPNPYLIPIYRRALQGQDPARLQISFDAAVIEKYRGAAGFSLDRTDTVGRIKREGGWALDVGIADEERTVHASFQDLLGLPESERDHWAQHAVALPLSRAFLQMRLQAGACIDDGEVRDW
ncbi:MAG: hypothetical protein WBD55_09245 [Dehalococcoidia bacterium]